jgi:Zn-dependent protease
MALAGPVSNLLLAVLGLLVLRLGLDYGVWTVPASIELDRLVDAPEGSPWQVVGRVCSVVFTLNLVLALLNALPLPPLDGASVLAGFFAPFRSLRARVVSSPLAGLVGLLVAWQVLGRLFTPLYTAILGWLYR